MPTNENFEIVEVQIPELSDGEFLVRNIWMSVDAYKRGHMREHKSYVPPFELGKALEGGCVGKVIESKNGQLAVGDYVLGMKGWREYWISDGELVHQKSLPLLMNSKDTQRIYKILQMFFDSIKR